MAFTYHFTQKAGGKIFVKPQFNSFYLNEAMHCIVFLVQQNSFGSILEMLKNPSPDSFEDIVKQLDAYSENNTAKRNETLTVITMNSYLYTCRWIISNRKTNWKR